MFLHLPLLLVLPNLFDNDDKLEPTGFDSSREFKLTAVEDEPEDEDPDEESEGQFISLEAPDREERPDEARFRDQFESTADEEMARKEPGDRQEPGPAAPSRIKPEPQPSQPSNEQPEEPEPPSKEQTSPKKAPDSEVDDTKPAEPSEDSNPEKGEDDTQLAEEKPADEGLLEEGTEHDQQKADSQDLFPSPENMSAAFGGGSVDYLRDVEEGDKTLLNRKGSRYWTFMHRFKQQIVQEWSPGEKIRKRDPHGKVYGVKDRLTQLRITLNGDGSLRAMYVAHPSGVDFYDEEAVRAIKAAAPFPNPPEGLKDKDGQIHITFSFLVSRGKMRGIQIWKP